jgi:hypothetical protein
MEIFSVTLLRNFPLKKSDFLGIFRNILTGFYCMCKNRTENNHTLRAKLVTDLSEHPTPAR